MTPGDSWLLVSQRRENEGSSGVVGPSSSLGPSDYQEPLTSGDAGNKPVKTDQFEDVKILLQSPPQFRKEMQVLCMPRPHDIPEKFTLEFGVLDTDLDNISLWLRAPENLYLGFSQARCISLVCYSFQDLRPHPIPQGESHNGLEVLWPVPWTKILPVSFSMNDEFTFMFPPYEASEYHLDISHYVRLGQNKLYFLLVNSMSEYVLLLYSHYPTENQLIPLRAHWDERKCFIERLAWLVHPICPPPKK